MAGIKKRTRKAIVKPVSKLVRRHGAEAVTALVTGVIGGLASYLVYGGVKRRAASARRGNKAEAA